MNIRAMIVVVPGIYYSPEYNFNRSGFSITHHIMFIPDWFYKTCQL